jgi:hypothetical protein
MATTAAGAVLGLFNDADKVADAIDNLKESGFESATIKTYTDTPYPEGAFGDEPEHHRLYVFPFMGGLCGFSVALLITIGTQMAYPLITGGKPVLAIPPMIHVIYEGTMLGAILFTVLGILFESRLPNFSAAPYDPRISEGYIGLLVSKVEGRADAAANTMRKAGAVDIVNQSPSQRR